MFRVLPVLVLVSACGSLSAPLAPPSAPSLSRSSYEYKVRFPAMADNFFIDGIDLAAAQVVPVTFSKLPFCDGVGQVLNNALSVNYSCQGEGLLSISYAGASGVELLSLLDAAVRRGGGSVTYSENSVAVIGGGGDVGSFSGEGSNVPDARPMENGVQAFTTENLPVALERRLADQNLQASQKAVGSLPAGVSIDQVREVARELGISPAIAEASGVVFSVGTVRENTLLLQALNKSEFITVPFSVTGIDQASVDALGASFLDVTFNDDPATGNLWVAGPRRQVLEAFRALSGVMPVRGDIRLSAAFISHDVDNSDAYSAALGFSLQNGIGAGQVLNLGTVAASVPGVSVVVSKARSAASVVVHSQPKIVTTSGKAGSFQSGEKIPVLAGFNEDGRQDVQYVDTGTIVRATPLLLPSGRIRVKLLIEVSGVTGEGVAGSPVIATRSVQTEIEVSNGDTVFLSGLEFEQGRNSKGRSFGFLPSSEKSRLSRSLDFFMTVTIE